MIRLLIWSSLAAIAGVVLFQIKYEVQSVEDELIRTRRQIAANQESIHILRAEWSYLNDPQRLSDLAKRHLTLAPMSPAQIGTIAALPAAAPAIKPAESGELPAGEPVLSTNPAEQDPISALLNQLGTEQP